MTNWNLWSSLRLLFLSLSFSLHNEPARVEAKARRRGGGGRRATNRRRKRNAARNNKMLKIFHQRQNDCIVTCHTSNSNNRNSNNMAENEMCISQCMSPTCHDQNYRLHEKKLLEPGEFDEVRAIAFEECVKDEIRNLTEIT